MLPQWINLPKFCFDALLEFPFVFDLLKSETHDWELNGKIYGPNQADPSLGILGGFVSRFISLAQKKDIFV